MHENSFGNASANIVVLSALILTKAARQAIFADAGFYSASVWAYFTLAARRQRLLRVWVPAEFVDAKDDSRDREQHDEQRSIVRALRAIDCSGVTSSSRSNLPA